MVASGGTKITGILPLFTAFCCVYLTVESILELVIDALPKKNYRGIPGITWELPRDRGSPTFFGNPVMGKLKPRSTR